MKNVLVLCTGNSCRSQILHGFLQKELGAEFRVYSAGIQTHGVNPLAIKVMEEAGVSIAHHSSNHVDEYASVDFSWLVTVCDHANENCPFIPGRFARIHRNFPDPAKAQGTEEQILHAFRSVRDQLQEFAVELNNRIRTVKAD